MKIWRLVDPYDDRFARAVAHLFGASGRPA
jgi:hypothetical protein